MNFIFDLDGTLSFDRFSIDGKIKEVLLSAEDFGHEVSFASARSYRDCVDMLGDDLAQKRVIGLNGGLVYEEGQLILEYNLDKEAYHDVLSYCQTYNLPYFVDNTFNYASDNEEYFPFIESVDPLNLAEKVPADQLEHPIKMVIYMGNHEELLADLSYHIKSTDIIDLSYHEEEKCLYLNPCRVSKASTISEIFEEPFIAFGNDKNDIEMFKLALYSIQIGGFTYLKPYADEQVDADSQLVATKIAELFQEFQGK
ncbi:HAD hydrolase family protein [Streptococcus dentapri]|uniref:HAD hydrolase family protein n=1 Tax=Streptococcus dentapri TaxID=573564 RepID=A0ABV8CYR2_9STRE